MQDAAPDESEQRQRGSALVKRYFAQITVGCGRGGCPNVYCRSCLDGKGTLDPTKAALMSLELAQSGPHMLCDELPPFLHLICVKQLLAGAGQSHDTTLLENEVAAVFSNSDALNRSFVSSAAEAQQARTRHPGPALRHYSSLPLQSAWRLNCLAQATPRIQQRRHYPPHRLLPDPPALAVPTLYPDRHGRGSTAVTRGVPLVCVCQSQRAEGATTS